MSTCEVCGAEMPPRGKRGPARRVCSGRCRTVRWRGESTRPPAVVLTCGWCGADLKRPKRGPDPRWCSSTCRVRNGQAIRRVRMEGAGEMPRAYVIARDRSRCHICGILCSPSATDRRRRLTIDHLIPVSAGGTNDPVNLAVACWSCNCARGVDRLPAQLALVG